MAGVWCDVLLVRYRLNGSALCSTFYPVPFSSGGLTVQRVLSIEAELKKRSWGVRGVQVMGYDLLNEMLIDEDRVETIISRADMESFISKSEVES